MRLARFGVAAAAAVVAAACATTDQREPGAGALGALTLEACRPEGVEEDVRCGVFHVAENRARPSGRTLPLKVIVISARAAQPREPVFVLSGGPGQAATDGARWLVGSWERENHDVVLVDVRGSGEGHRLDCRFDDGLQGFVEPLFWEGPRYRQCREALERQGVDLTHYTTPIAMDDLEAVRRALGYRKINLLGGSYGTRAALVYLRRYGANVHSAFLSGLSPFENRAPLYHAAAAQRAFERVADQCAADAACGARYPDVRGDLAAVLARLRVEPARVRVRHPVTDESAEVLLSASGFGDGLRVMLYSVESGRRVPLLLQRARAGDLAPFADAAVRSGYGARQSLRLGLTLSVSCPEDVARIRPEDVAPATAGSFIGDHRVRGQMAACAAWPRATLPRDYAAPFRSQVPAVLVSGDLDPVTPPQWGEAMRRYLPNSVHVVAPGAHVADNPCIAAAGRALFLTGRVQGLDTSCVSTLTLPPFDLAAQP